MNIGVICDISSNNESVGVIGIDKSKSKSEIGYIVNDNKLEQVIEMILDNDFLHLLIKEKVNNNQIIRKEKISLQHPYYLTALNYHLPYPWKILGIKYVEGDLEKILQDSYDYIKNIRGDISEK